MGRRGKENRSPQERTAGGVLSGIRESCLYEAELIGGTKEVGICLTDMADQLNI